MTKQTVTNELQQIPGVGKAVSRDLVRLGITKITDLRNKNPEKLYEQLCIQVGYPVDRCMLYTFRCAVYYATHKKPKPELLKWWNWKDESVKNR